MPRARLPHRCAISLAGPSLADPDGISGITSVVVSRDERVVAYNYVRSLGTAYLIRGLK